jgi:hypothetical protein
MCQIFLRFPALRLRASEDFDGTKGAIWTSGEEGEASDGQLLFDYYAVDSAEACYVMKVHREMRAMLDSAGWRAEFVDPGTVMLYGD